MNAGSEMVSTPEGRSFDAGAGRWRETKDGPKDFYKTKLCEKFASLGRCPYDDRCTYAHGYGELRPYPRQGSPLDGPPFPVETPEKEPGGVSEGHSGNSGNVRSGIAHSEGTSHPHQHASGISYVDKVKGICGCLGIGTPVVKPGAVQEAMADVKSKALLKGNVYADDVHGYI